MNIFFNTGLKKDNRINHIIIGMLFDSVRKHGNRLEIERIEKTKKFETKIFLFLENI